MAGDAYETVYEIAAEQHGVFSAAQAKAGGISAMAIVMMERRGVLERLSRGVYRLVYFPLDGVAQYVEAMLWPSGEMGTISHESALALYGVSDANPSRIHITLPKRFRVRRPVPPRIVIHQADLADDETWEHEGVRVTVPARTIRDCWQRNLGNEIVEQAIDGFMKQGYLTGRQAAVLQSQLNL